MTHANTHVRDDVLTALYCVPPPTRRRPPAQRTGRTNALSLLMTIMVIISAFAATFTITSRLPLMAVASGVVYNYTGCAALAAMGVPSSSTTQPGFVNVNEAPTFLLEGPCTISGDLTINIQIHDMEMQLSLVTAVDVRVRNVRLEAVDGFLPKLSISFGEVDRLLAPANIAIQNTSWMAGPHRYPAETMDLYAIKIFNGGLMSDYTSILIESSTLVATGIQSLFYELQYSFLYVYGPLRLASPGASVVLSNARLTVTNSSGYQLAARLINVNIYANPMLLLEGGSFRVEHAHVSIENSTATGGSVLVHLYYQSFDTLTMANTSTFFITSSEVVLLRCNGAGLTAEAVRINANNPLRLEGKAAIDLTQCAVSIRDSNSSTGVVLSYALAAPGVDMFDAAKVAVDSVSLLVEGIIAEPGPGASPYTERAEVAVVALLSDVGARLSGSSQIAINNAPVFIYGSRLQGSQLFLSALRTEGFTTVGGEAALRITDATIVVDGSDLGPPQPTYTSDSSLIITLLHGSSMTLTAMAKVAIARAKIRVTDARLATVESGTPPPMRLTIMRVQSLSADGEATTNVEDTAISVKRTAITGVTSFHASALHAHEGSIELRGRSSLVVHDSTAKLLQTSFASSVGVASTSLSVLDTTVELHDNATLDVGQFCAAAQGNNITTTTSGAGGTTTATFPILPVALAGIVHGVFGVGAAVNTGTNATYRNGTFFCPPDPTTAPPNTTTAPPNTTTAAPNTTTAAPNTTTTATTTTPTPTPNATTASTATPVPSTTTTTTTSSAHHSPSTTASTTAPNTTTTTSTTTAPPTTTTAPATTTTTTAASTTTAGAADDTPHPHPTTTAPPNTTEAPPKRPAALVAEASQSVAGRVGAFTGVSNAAGVVSTTNAIMRIAQCSEESDDEVLNVELPPLIHPLGFAVGEGPLRFWRGAVIGNTIVLPTAAALVFRLVVPLSLLLLVRFRRRATLALVAVTHPELKPALDDPDLSLIHMLRLVALPEALGAESPSEAVAGQWARAHGALQALRRGSGWPSIVVLPYIALAEGTAAAVTQLLRDSTDPGPSIAVAIVGIVFLCGLCAWWVFALMRIVPRHSVRLVPATPIGARIAAALTGCSTKPNLSDDKTAAATPHPAPADASWGWAMLQPAMHFKDADENVTGVSGDDDAAKAGLLQVPLLEQQSTSSGDFGPSPSLSSSAHGPKGTEGSVVLTGMDALLAAPPDDLTPREELEEQYEHFIGGKGLRWAEIAAFGCSIGVGIAEGLPGSLCRERVTVAFVLIIVQGLTSLSTLVPAENAAMLMLAAASSTVAGAALTNVYDITDHDGDVLERVGLAANIIGLLAMAIALLEPIATARRLLLEAAGRTAAEIRALLLNGGLPQAQRNMQWQLSIEMEGDVMTATMRAKPADDDAAAANGDNDPEEEKGGARKRSATIVGTNPPQAQAAPTAAASNPVAAEANASGSSDSEAAQRQALKGADLSFLDDSISSEDNGAGLDFDDDSI